MPKLRATLAALLLLTPLALATTADDSEEKPAPKIDSVVTLLGFVLEADENTARECLHTITRAIQNGQVPAERVEGIRDQLAEKLIPILQDEAHALRFDVALLATGWKDPDGIKVTRNTLANESAEQEQRLAALQALIAAEDENVLDQVRPILEAADPNAAEFHAQVLAALARLSRIEVAELVISQFPEMAPPLQTRGIELLTQRPAWAAALLTAVADKQISKDALNLNQLRRIASFENEDLQQQFQAIYGALREGRDPQREQLVNRMRDLLSETPGDPHAGAKAFKKVCAQCHKIYGEGEEVGPDITRNGRNNWEQLLSNVFDPSLVIGPGYQARQLVTTDGRVLTGLPVEESDQRIILKVQGGKLETIPADQIEAYKVSELSLMPEQLEKLLTEQEIADLMSFLALDKHPDDPDAKFLPDAPRFEESE
ncbi:MAG: hypothetical protein DWQ34_03610 [Planctomycetota bacterium]|nr:MAG: hypothetical protein DWQ34_03610 [Planctomycetota bacterium]REK24717.1 MAG: hypothetical protein DWQ41_13350 [Planctomycetota bacterium]REK29988.1 MAG: hypothetical protein DWQ45_22035 [Planctomycetota bacterium]